MRPENTDCGANKPTAILKCVVFCCSLYQILVESQVRVCFNPEYCHITNCRRCTVQSLSICGIRNNIGPYM